MKRLFLLSLSVLTFMLISADLMAQFTITDETKAAPLMYRQIKYHPKKSNFISKTTAWHNKQRQEKRLKHNFFETKTSITFNQFSYMNWSGGGENSYNGKFTTLNTHAYTNKKLSVDSYFNASIGLGERDNELWKTEDNLELNSVINYQLWGKWTYSFGLNFTTQFAAGYSDNNVFTSDFFSPATLKPFLGVSYRHSDTQIITIAPLSGNLLFVCDKELSLQGAFGVEKGKIFKPTIGGYINIQWTQPIDRKGFLSYKANLQTFFDYGFKSAPVLGWESWLNLDVFKYLTVGIYVNVVFNDKIARQDGHNTFWQVKQSIGISVSYNFKNKDKKPNKRNLINIVDFDY